ncbi:MAG TPA: hypothetical protein PKB10_14460, partial [Tepidisphaeraceae bacterium]|nr:hypothetical protein [Tepidisphaeraceae bacterium]
MKQLKRWCSAMLIGSLTMTPLARAQEAAPDHPLTGNEITPASREAVERGLDWLARQQQADGSFGRQDS